MKFNFDTLSLANCATASNGNHEFCYCNACSENEGDCNSHDECQDGLVCGSDNCPDSLKFDNGVDCCYEGVGSENFCTIANPCREDEGDCDSNYECQNNLFCVENYCPASLGFDSEVDCCSSTEIMSPNYPNSYPNNAKETWLLTAPTGSIITLQFHSFQVRIST